MGKETKQDKKKRFIMDVSEREHYTIKREALKRNISMRELVTKAITYFLDRYSK